MARKNQGGEGAAIIIAVLLFLPFLLVSLISFQRMKRDYLRYGTEQRVMDIRRAGTMLVAAGGILLGFCFAANFVYQLIVGKSSNAAGLLIVILIVAIGLCSGCILARRIAVLYLGVIADKEHDVLYFPYDMQSYALADYFSLRFLRDYGNVDAIKLSDIKKMTRGRGKELYIHGDFGSRGIIMSGKQKRDECLAMIQSLSGRKGLLMAEVEGF